jgi:hypothetical protein
MRKTLAAAASAALIILGWADTNVAAAASTTKSVPAENFSCGTAAKTEKTGAPGSSSLGIAFAGNDPTQTFTWGSKFTVKFDAVSKISDVVDWTIADYTGKVHASGSISVVEGTTTASVSCSSTISGYFAVSAKLSKSGVIPAQQGSRPEGYAAFGVLPNVADFVPAFNASLDTRRCERCGGRYRAPADERESRDLLDHDIAIHAADRAATRGAIQPRDLSDRPQSQGGDARANRLPEWFAVLGEHRPVPEHPRIVSAEILQLLAKLRGAGR